jgi:hypothetical protein
MSELFTTMPARIMKPWPDIKFRVCPVNPNPDGDADHRKRHRHHGKKGHPQQIELRHQNKYKPTPPTRQNRTSGFGMRPSPRELPRPCLPSGLLCDERAPLHFAPQAKCPRPAALPEKPTQNRSRLVTTLNGRGAWDQIQSAIFPQRVTRRARPAE